VFTDCQSVTVAVSAVLLPFNDLWLHSNKYLISTLSACCCYCWSWWVSMMICCSWKWWTVQCRSNLLNCSWLELRRAAVPRDMHATVRCAVFTWTQLLYKKHFGHLWNISWEQSGELAHWWSHKLTCVVRGRELSSPAPPVHFLVKTLFQSSLIFRLGPSRFANFTSAGFQLLLFAVKSSRPNQNNLHTHNVKLVSGHIFAVKMSMFWQTEVFGQFELHSESGCVHIDMSASSSTHIRVPRNTSLHVFQWRPFILIRVLYEYGIRVNFTRTSSFCAGHVWSEQHKICINFIYTGHDAYLTSWIMSL